MLPAPQLHTASLKLNPPATVPTVVTVLCPSLIVPSENICFKYYIIGKWYLVQKWLQRHSTSRKFTVTRHQDWAPQEMIHASGICVPLIDAHNNYSPPYHHHRRPACIYKWCVAAQSQSWNNHIAPGSDGIHQNMCHAYLTFHNSHNTLTHTSSISGIAPHKNASEQNLFIFHLF